ncbi:TonB-dependent receptor plug domain-containing protein [Alkalimonas mucilaginosa]|uniref:TonB-dependent receptor n=1 Tax=Alkalimonas mucilaginosa TaxID=3057676 RepID=A0ABU7JAG2_9GAMM|nr:TonB-dependent receptor [Alkalimonas sp. MEB004]MEE2022684.1 TonB-dependent receptor [Alkalimonas sp. MEB004]
MRKISVLATAIASALVSGSLFADEQTIGEAKVERIEVTGSRIRGVDLEGTQPLVVISNEDIKNSGASDIYELLRDLGQVRGGSGTFSTSESGATSTSTPGGQAAASLRGLGPASTLTLINGRRVAASSFAAGTQNFVDINSIPLAAIERVEILATGASAIYGADAVAGVINYILKSDYDGAELNLSYGNSTASSNDGRANVNFVIGRQVAGGNLTVFADYFDRKMLTAQDRSFTRDPALVSNYSYLPKLQDGANIYYTYIGRIGPGGYFQPRGAGDQYEVNPRCSNELTETELDELICAYYPNQDDVLTSPFKSASAGFMFNVELGKVRWSTDFFFSETKSSAFSSPAPIDQVNDAEGPMAHLSTLDIFRDTNGAFFMPAINPDFLAGVAGAPKYIATEDFDLVWDDFFDTPIHDRWVGYGLGFDARFNDPRTIDIKSRSFRLVSGLQGEVGHWDWETALTYSRSSSNQEASRGIYNRYKLHAALGGELCSDGQISSYNADTDTMSCSGGAELLGYFNPFLVGDATNDAQLALAQEVPTRKGLSTVLGWDARFSGELFEVQHGFVSAALGLELRREKITDTPSLNARARFENDYLVDVFGFGSSLSAASRNQAAAFAEIYAPLAERVELLAAGRYDHYNDFGGTFNPKVGLTWRPVDELILRGSWATSFRAPSLTQAGVQLRTTTATYDCSANQTVSDLYCDGQNFSSSPNVLELGNPDLQAETSESISLGLAWSPSRDTTITVDYWQFDHKRLVDTDMTAMLARTITDASVRHCGLVPQGQTGIAYTPSVCNVTDGSGLRIDQQGASLSEILAAFIEAVEPRDNVLPLMRDHVIQLENVGKQEVKGLDISFKHTLDFAGGRLGLDIDWTNYLSFKRNKAGSDEIESLVGTYRYPRNIGSARVSWRNDDLFLGLTALYTSSYQDDIGRLSRRNIWELEDLGELDADGNRQVASWTTLRASVGYDFDNAAINLSIDNLLDRDPPRVFGSSRGFDSINHNAMGRSYRLSFTYFF